MVDDIEICVEMFCIKKCCKLLKKISTIHQKFIHLIKELIQFLKKDTIHKKIDTIHIKKWIQFLKNGYNQGRIQLIKKNGYNS